MKYRILGKTGAKVSEIALGCWQLGGKWGATFDSELAHNTLQIAVNNNINCFDTADVYQDGMSEKSIGEFLKTQKNKPFVITKAGRKSVPHLASAYNEKQLRKYILDSRKNMDLDSLDMVLLHCPPTDVYYNPEVFDALDSFQKEGLIQNYGVSVERIEEGLKALEYDGVAAIEVIFNMFRLRPMELLFEKAKEKNVGIIVRVPLASGLLTGKFSKDTTFLAGDHRTFNRNGEAFDKGETFSGVDYTLGLEAVEELKKVFKGQNLSQVALRFILMFDAVSIVIPGASKEEHVLSNAQASELQPLTNFEMSEIRRIYDTYIRQSVHQLW